MKKYKYLFLVFLLIIIIFVFLYPGQMIQPGRLMNAHKELESDCFSCHVIFKGVYSSKCISCHQIKNIGVKTTSGMPVANANNISGIFHKELKTENCLSCHSDHEGVMTNRPHNRFSHDLIKKNKKSQCVKCHVAPKDRRHSNLYPGCVECHNVTSWSPASFNHEKYYKDNTQMLKDQCMKCHATPENALHEKFSHNCADCHTTRKWTPSNFTHNEYFQLDMDHDKKCITCHVNNNFQSYTCYECHEHTRSKIRGEHVEEGIYNYENCVRCHHNSNEHDAKRIWKSQRKKDYKEYEKYEEDDD